MSIIIYYINIIYYSTIHVDLLSFRIPDHNKFKANFFWSIYNFARSFKGTFGCFYLVTDKL